MKIRGTIESHSTTWLKKELRENYIVMDSHRATPEAYKIASERIAKIEQILRERQC